MHGSKIHVGSGEIVLALELSVKRTRRFDLPSKNVYFYVLNSSSLNLSLKSSSTEYRKLLPQVTSLLDANGIW